MIIPNIWNNNPNVPNHQPVINCIRSVINHINLEKHDINPVTSWYSCLNIHVFTMWAMSFHALIPTSIMIRTIINQLKELLLTIIYHY